MGDTTRSPIEFTELAREAVLRFADAGGDAGPAVRVQVASPSPLDPRYEITLIEPHEVSAEDVSFDHYGFQVVMESGSAQMLVGANIDWIETLNESGFKVENPNISPIGSKPLEGPLADRVQQVIDQYVNPGVAQHGGQVTLVEVRDETAFVQMAGGCQGCGMVDMTLKDGVEKTLLEHLPQLKAVRDVTDHSVTENAYY